MQYNAAAAADWYWLGQPIGQSTPVLYSSARGTLVELSDAGFLAWADGMGMNPAYAATPWPQNESRVATTEDLDDVLVGVGLPATGLTALTQEQMQSALMSATSAASSAIANQIYNDPAHAAAGQNAGMIVAISGGPPASSSPFFAAFNSNAQSWGMTPANFATLITTLMSQSMVLSAAQNACTVATMAATTSDQLATALSAFEAAIGGVVSSINAASPPVAIVPPPAITIKGVNA